MHACVSVSVHGSVCISMHVCVYMSRRSTESDRLLLLFAGLIIIIHFACIYYYYLCQSMPRECQFPKDGM